MEVSDVRRRLRGAIDEARRRATERRDRKDAASRVWERLLPDVAVPAFHLMASALTGEGLRFKVQHARRGRPADAGARRRGVRRARARHASATSPRDAHLRRTAAAAASSRPSALFAPGRDRRPDARRTCMA